ncbi:MAG: hypothetical protein LBV79_05095 [Candidatus Adiutrix sp.]|jgi:hypothetical protein|nr:hypothetical protein [Candidatus Adiutrix sp.]
MNSSEAELAKTILQKKLQARSKKYFGVTLGGLTKAFIFCFCFLFLPSYFLHVALRGEVSTGAPRSQEVAASLRSSLAAQKDVRLSQILKSSDSNKTYAVVWPAYELPKYFKCELFPSGDLEPLKIKYPYTDYIFMITSFDSTGAVDVATLRNYPAVFCFNQPLSCVPIEDAYLKVTATPQGMCYKLSGKEGGAAQ